MISIPATNNSIECIRFNNNNVDSAWPTTLIRFCLFVHRIYLVHNRLWNRTPTNLPDGNDDDDVMGCFVVIQCLLRVNILAGSSPLLSD